MAGPARRGRRPASEAGYEGDRVGEAPTAIQELQRSVSAVGDGHDVALRIPVPHQQQQLPGPFGHLLVALTLLFGVAFGRSQRREEGQGPHPPGPRDRGQKRHADPSQAAGLHEVAVAGTHRVPVDALRFDLLSPAPLQRLIDAQDERFSFGHESLHEQPQQHTARLPARPVGAAQDPMVAMEAPLLVQAHRAQGRTDGPSSGSEDRPRHQHHGVLEDALGKQWRERSQNLYHRGR